MDKKETSIILEGGTVSKVSDSKPRRNCAGQFDLEEKENQNKERK